MPLAIRPLRSPRHRLVEATCRCVEVPILFLPTIRVDNWHFKARAQPQRQFVLGWHCGTEPQSSGLGSVPCFTMLTKAVWEAKTRETRLLWSRSNLVPNPTSLLLFTGVVAASFGDGSVGQRCKINGRFDDVAYVVHLQSCQGSSQFSCGRLGDPACQLAQVRLLMMSNNNVLTHFGRRTQ